MQGNGAAESDHSALRLRHFLILTSLRCRAVRLSSTTKKPSPEGEGLGMKEILRDQSRSGMARVGSA
jgi:hypothetical protein